MKAMRYIVLILILVAATGCNMQPSAEVNRHACIQNLFQLTLAKQLWAVENKRSTNEAPTMADIAKYMGHHTNCPSGGTYTLGPAWRNVACSIKGHELTTGTAVQIKPKAH